MQTPAAHEVEARGIADLLRCPRRLALLRWPAATLLYGAAAGLILHEQPYVAGVVMTAVWLAALRRHRRP
jgi:hypothetical protein